MKSIIISILSFVAAFFAIQYGMDYYREFSAIQKANQQMETLREEVRKENPNEPEVLAVQKAAIKKAEENIASKGSHRERVQTAAETFLGFYLVNYRERATYCKEQGIDITPFTSAFKDIHAKEYSAAVSAVSYGQSEVDKLYGMVQPQLEKVIVQDMGYIAKENGISLSEACQLISNNASIVVPEMHISVTQPAVYKTLMSEK